MSYTSGKSQKSGSSITAASDPTPAVPSSSAAAAVAATPVTATPASYVLCGVQQGMIFVIFFQ